MLDPFYVVCCVLAADFLSGLIHWAEDTWLPLGKSELLDRWIVRDNVEHHRSPGKIRSGTYWETNRVTIVLAIVVGAILAALRVHAWEPYLVVALLSHSNQVHLWAHSSRVPRAVGWLQSAGILLKPAQHARHHRSPYATNFCAMTNVLNPVLESVRFWRRLEVAIASCGVSVVRGTPARAGF